MLARAIDWVRRPQPFNHAIRGAGAVVASVAVAVASGMLWPTIPIALCGGLLFAKAIKDFRSAEQ